MNRTRIIGPTGVDLGADRVTTSLYLSPSPYAVLHVASVIGFYARPGFADPAMLRDLAAKATEIADWLEKQQAEAGELDAA
ncbi:MAG: hypothetical protein LBV60_21305 [Streptomyces sp.]|jgi:hypothetical protein|nr:hypothetical protein [Streptomyces sp.]